MIRGMVGEMQAQGIWRPGEVGLQAVADEAATRAAAWAGCSGKYRDDISGQVLLDDLVREARGKELRYFCGKGV